MSEIDQQTPFERVYDNCLILSTVYSFLPAHTPARTDLKTCLTLSQSGFPLAMKALYAEVPEDIVSRLANKRCAINRLTMYCHAVRGITLAQPTLPNDIDIYGYIGSYPNLTHIKFCLPVGNGTRVTPESMSTLRLYAKKEGNERERDLEEEGEGSEASPLLGELELVIREEPQWPRGINLANGFGLTGENKRFKLVSLIVGPSLSYSRRLPSTNLWSIRDRLVKLRDPEEARSVFGDLIRFHASLNIKARQHGLLLSSMPKLKQFGLVMGDYPWPTDLRGPDIFGNLGANETEIESWEVLLADWRHSSLTDVWSPAVARRQTTAAMRFNSQTEGLADPPFSEPLRLFDTSTLPESKRNRDVHINLCVYEGAWLVNPFKVACYMLRAWPATAEVTLNPGFFEPSQKLVAWMKEVVNIRLQLRRLMLSGNGVGFRKVS